MNIKNKIKKIYTKVVSNLKQIAIQNIAISVMLVMFSFVLISNVLRVVATGFGNYETFEEERNGLNKIKSINDDLKNEYSYVSSDEFKKIILKDSLAIAEENERLYRTKVEVKYFDKEIELLNIKEKEGFGDWWSLLINNWKQYILIGIISLNLV